MDNIIKYLLYIFLGIILFIIFNNINKFSIGIPDKRSGDKFIISWIGDPPDSDSLSNFRKWIFRYDPDTENVEILTPDMAPPGGHIMAPSHDSILIQDILIDYIRNAINYALQHDEPEGDEEGRESDLIQELFAFLLSFESIGFNNLNFIDWLLNTDTENINPFVILFRDNLREELLRTLINVEFIKCSASSNFKRQKI